MLSAAEIASHLAGLRYVLQGYRWEVREDPFEGPYVRLLVDVPDSYDPSKPVTLGIDSYLSPNDRASGEALDLWLAWRLHRIASHEAREMLQRDGRPVFDPHKEPEAA